MPDKPTLHVCHFDRAGPGVHACRRAADALVAAGVNHDRAAFGRNKPFGLMTSGTRPGLRAMSGQEKLPVLELPDATTLNGTSAIIAWAEANAST